MSSPNFAETSSAGRRRRSKRRTPAYRKVLAWVWPEQMSIGHKLGTWFAVAALVYLSVHAASMGLAHLQVLRVEHQLNYWYKRGSVASPSSMASALQSIEKANRLHPDNPYQLTLQARLLEWRAYNDGNVILDDYRAALALYQRAAALRPLWPDTWAEMAQVKVRLSEFDADLGRYLIRADELGPYTPAVHLAIAQANLPRLPILADEQRFLLETHLVRGVTDPRSKNEILRLVQQYGQEKFACEWMSTAEQLDNLPKFCES